MDEQELIGRFTETQALKNALRTNKSEMIAVIGRRRVGKTFLIRQVYHSKIDFEMTGIQNRPKSEQLQNFASKLAEFTGAQRAFQAPASWQEAFHDLKVYLESKKTRRKRVVFFDELPWLATPKSGFLAALGHFWNDWASVNNIVFVICGSAASWMIRRVVNHKGSLHNRITRRIDLAPFTLAEVEKYLKKRGGIYSRYEITQLYIMIGGIPHYLDHVDTSQSIAQNCDRLFFAPDGILRHEFENLYASLYDKPKAHIAVITALASKWKGMTRDELVRKSKLSDGGGMTRVLQELEAGSFISQVSSFGNIKKNRFYRLSDPFTLFYLKFVAKSASSHKPVFFSIVNTSKWRSWAGYAFENLCFDHSKQIETALGVYAIYTEISSFQIIGNDVQQGTQIDLLIDRADGVINLCEIKFHDSEFVISKKYAKALREKRTIFRQSTRTRKTVFVTMITPYGIKPNQHSGSVVQNEVTIDHLFKP
ncbi:MAG: ATP-binding protein [Bacteroidetes bacterium]|nr:MAG: ATP-binding protein [Bacteroidota bacterium]